MQALSLILDKPIIGHGLDYFDATTGIEAGEIHNFWLRITTQGGLGVLFFMLVFVSNTVKQGFLVSRSHGLTSTEMALARASTAALLSGLAMSMFEPHALIGSFQTSAMWWTAVGIVVGFSAKLARLRRIRPVGRIAYPVNFNQSPEPRLGSVSENDLYRA
jgi:O-antigen ligase